MSLGLYREQIDNIDREILELFQQRMDIVKNVANYKIKNNMSVLRPEREAEILDNQSKLARPEYSQYARGLFEKLMELSRDMQENIIRSININK